MLHPQFKLNGIGYNETSLLEVSTELVKEGNPFEKTVGSFLIEWFNNSDIVNVRTSGSTGTPKQITLRKKHMVNSALATGNFFNLEPENSALLCLSADFIAGKMMLVRALVIGLDLTLVDPTSNPLKDLSDSFDFSAMVPLQVANSLTRLKQIKTLIIGGAPVSISLKEKLKSIKTSCYETYGMTETITHIAVRALNQNDQDDYFELLTDISVAIDNRGCLTINAPGISDVTIITNDLVELIDDKRFRWLGRYDTMINSGGVKLIPEQIEAKLAGLFENRFFIAGTPDEKLGQKLTLVVEGKQDLASIEKLLEKSRLLTKYEFPKEIIIVTKFKETLSGKIHRNKTLEEL